MTKKMVTSLPCLHSFHLICTESWKSTQISSGKQKILCPLCKQIFDIEEEKEEEYTVNRIKGLRFSQNKVVTGEKSKICIIVSMKL
jgi:hypothetical protein